VVVSFFLIFFLFRNLVKPSEMPRPLALTGITEHTQKHFTSSYKTPKKEIGGGGRTSMLLYPRAENPSLFIYFI